MLISLVKHFCKSVLAVSLLIHCQDQTLNKPIDLAFALALHESRMNFSWSDLSPFQDSLNQGNLLGTPIFNPSPGIQTARSEIVITVSPSDASLFYTTNGSIPTSASQKYTSPLANNWSLSGLTIRAIATKPGFSDSPVATGIFSYPPLKTGQTGSQATGDDGNLQKGISRGYTNNADGTVTDQATGLIWQRCSIGQTFTFTGCSGSASTMNWSTAGSTCASLNFAGRSWRLPSYEELETLVDYSVANPNINSIAFPNTPGNFYWSSTTYPENTNLARITDMGSGTSALLTKTLSYSVRCVSGPSKGYSAVFVDNGDGTILDRSTGLVWQKCSNGQSNNSVCLGFPSPEFWLDGITYCNGLNLASRSWRLPNTNELKSIVNTNASSGPKIDTGFFPGTAASYYWTSTNSPFNLIADAYLIDFDTGEIVIDSKMTPYLIRCVSDP